MPQPPRAKVTECCTLQDEYDAGAPARVTATLVHQDGTALVALHQYAPGSEHDVTNALLLTEEAWATLAEMWILRYPDAAQRQVTRARGWEA
jgi:hypothetical protein